MDDGTEGQDNPPGSTRSLIRVTEVRDNQSMVCKLCIRSILDLHSGSGWGSQPECHHTCFHQCSCKEAIQAQVFRSKLNPIPQNYCFQSYSALELERHAACFMFGIQLIPSLSHLHSGLIQKSFCTKFAPIFMAIEQRWVTMHLCKITA